MEVALFDWLRMLDQKMEYDIRHGDRNSAEFKAHTGLLTSDPASPVRWNFFMADLIMLEDDSILSGIRIAILAQSRQYTSNPLSATGFAAQTERTHHAVLTKLHCCQHDQDNQQDFWSSTCEPPVQTWRNHADCHDRRKYLGINFRTDPRNMFGKAKASIAVVHRIMGIEYSTGLLTLKSVSTSYAPRRLTPSANAECPFPILACTTVQ
jgi:hypothetical protein